MAFRELLRHWTYAAFAPGTLLRSKYEAFQRLLRYDAMCLDLIADLEEIRYGYEHADWERVAWLVRRLRRTTGTLVDLLVQMHPVRHMGLPEYFKKIDFYLQLKAAPPEPAFSPPYVLPLHPLAPAADSPGNESANEAANESLVGGKAANLVRAMHIDGVQTPPCVVVTSNAFNYFLENNSLRRAINRRLQRITLDDPEKLSELAAEIRTRIVKGEIPAEVAAEIRRNAHELAGPHGMLALRSSAVGEDGEISFAGQYESMLFVPPENAEAAYRKVIAGKYAPKALTYRMLHGLPDFEAPMAVLMMPMVDAVRAGVAYSLDPDRQTPTQNQGYAGVHVVEGPGAALVSGEVDPQIFRLTRPQSSDRPEKPQLRKEACSVEAVTRPLLRPDQAARVASLALSMERELGGEREIEWAMDRDDQLYLLQNRICPPSRTPSPTPSDDTFQPPEGEAPLCTGQCLSSGWASGPVVHARAVLNAADVPEGAIVAVRTLTPSLARVVEKAAAVVAAAGGRASHFAAIAREFGLPVIGGVKDVFDKLPSGEEVTVYAPPPTSGREASVWSGNILPQGLKAQERRERSSLARRMDAFMDMISRLNLTDPEAPEFSPKHCRSMHDFVRYCHEMSVREMFSLVGKGGRGLSGARRLESGLPISLYLLDLGDGLFPAASDPKIATPEDIRSAPMWSLWWGLSCQEANWSANLPHFDWDEFDRISGGIFDPKSKLLASYAVLSESYLHLMIRFGYHFSQVDSVCSPTSAQNYVNFRFKGGGGLPEQRLLRLRFIRAVLEAFDFTTKTRGDMLDANFIRASEKDTQRRLVVVGRLLAVTRLMDMGLGDDSDIERMARDFVQRAEEGNRQ
ncbi:MAG: PEP/pyruvate-binding domain-containing protein [Desulfovibrio sp.]|uniref:PEP/pyruvate-binding domain-containing protein n=1 Tax=Desulfovibrio sp. 7SRBS1 TaxID=3378064 RepID=UPI003B3E6DF9